MAGIMFQDVSTLLLDPKAFKDTVDLFVERYKGKNISVVAGKNQSEDKGRKPFYKNGRSFFFFPPKTIMVFDVPKI